MCSAYAERDVHFVRNVSFGSDVRFAREQGTQHITLRPTGAKHHCAIALHHYGEAITSLRLAATCDGDANCFEPLAIRPQKCYDI